MLFLGLPAVRDGSMEQRRRNGEITKGKRIKRKFYVEEIKGLSFDSRIKMV